ncbi:MAG: ATP-binding protein [Candidatus Omnitrophica bacterium]|nr:ATP-binding protein [Candidatus Omnitrophota bacterium]
MYKRSIRKKVIIVIFLVSLTVMAIGVGLGYFFSFKILHNMVGDVHRKLSQLLANNVSEDIDAEIERIKSYTARQTQPDEILKEDKNIVKADILTEARKKDGVDIGGLEFDETANAWVIPISSGNYRIEIATAKFFDFLENFRIDDTGHAVIVDAQGNVIFHPGASWTNAPFTDKNDYERLLRNKGQYGTIYEPKFHKGKMFVAFSEVTSPALLENNTVWRVFIDEDAREVFAPLNKIIIWVIAAVLLLIIIMDVIAYLFSTILVRPIEKLYEAAVRIMKGDWDYKIDIKTGDEIEHFADAFKEMIANVRGKQEELLMSKSALEELSQSLEKKVQERTKDCTNAQNELTNYARELERALMIKSDFISMASHELRTPLTAIKEGIALVLEGQTGAITERQKEFLSMSKRNVDRLARLINDILDIQKLEQGKMVLKMEPHDINEVVSDVANIMVAVAAEKGLKLSVKPEAGLPKVKFDKDKITQVLTNLLNNAVKFTQKGEIQITTARGSNFVQVSVRDTGQGIKEEEMPKLFQKFSQLEGGLERKTGGSGLGLTISKAIIDKHRGKIWAESRVDKGSVFHFILPITERRGLEIG